MGLAPDPSALPALAAAVATPAFLTEVVMLLVAAALIAYLSHRLGLVPIVGFLVTGMVIGPNALALIRNQELVNGAAELGVILLLFTIGIEFSLEKLARIKRLILGGGGLQLAITTGLTTVILMPFGVSWRAALFTGFLVALSSTAIVLKLLAGRRETDSPVGQASVGILIFQDLAIIVLVLLTPILGGARGSVVDIAVALGKAGVIIVAVLLIARRLMPRVLEDVARTCSQEIFVLTVIAICLGTAALTNLAGVSLSLGAFVAGLMVSESKFSSHALAEILPLQVLFSATFFVSVGMLLDLRFLADHFPFILGVVVAVIALKTVTAGASVWLLGYRPAAALAVGLTLAQVGEFSFVLQSAGAEVGLMPAGVAGSGPQTFIAATVLLMVATPALFAAARRVSGAAFRLDRTRRGAGPATEPAAGDMVGHVLVAGYGEVARRLVPALAREAVPFVITTLNPAGAREAEERGWRIVRGDAARRQTLSAAGLPEAGVVVVADHAPLDAERVVEVARGLRADVPIVARVQSPGHVRDVRRRGATAAVVDEIETAAGVLRAVLEHAGKDEERVAARVTTERELWIASAAESRWRYLDPTQPVAFRPAAPAACRHVETIRPVTPSADGCESCLRIGDTWVHLRVCLTCGHVGCCDSSRHRHATAHYRDTGHPIVRSGEPGEDWAWCFVDEVTVNGRE
jgi:CPA2 family monovalent cation:H+ antiporter-2